MPRVRAAVKPPGGSAQAPAPYPAGASSMAVKRPPPIKRAASESQVLPPTPPRTTHKRKRRSRSRVTDSSSEDEDAHDVPEPESDEEDGRSGKKKDGEVHIGHKKRKTMTLDAIAEELSQARAEEIFWMGEDAAGSSNTAGPSSSKQAHRVVKNRASTRARSRTRSPSSSPPPAPHLLRRGHTGLISPPPSRRAPVVVPRLATPPPEPVKEKGKGFPERDSPNNPFLADDSPGSVPASDVQSSPEPRTPQKHVEKPTLTYVFRGVKMLVSNPHYTSEEAAAETEARAQLPVTHPDFSPSDTAAPKLLFPEARKRDLARRRAHPTVPRPTSPTPTTTRRRAGSSSSDETRDVANGAPGPSTVLEPEVDTEAIAAAMAARVARRMHKGVFADGDAPRTRPSSRSGEPRLPEKDRTDPLKRALGPVRKR
ncbi:hypothetical protein BD310DRAFT_711797 [Dichomitus squalens]|uniref:Uncharacterized protein n=1 Tax=Dichomitus squalens TaxID=114155 RepID=A0A4Q9PLM2_9APHY|nr:hypothetical protein BD310DRAFT_711797 [Dichomitus squalens]